MVAGIRLHHPTLASCMLVVEYPTPFASGKPRKCSLCKKDHARKSSHLRLDPQGDVIVSEKVFELLKTVFLAGMQVVNEVPKPPTTFVGAVEQPKLYVVDNKLSADQNADPFYVPGRDKYKSRDVVHAGLQKAGVVLKPKEE